MKRNLLLIKVLLFALLAFVANSCLNVDANSNEYMQYNRKIVSKDGRIIKEYLDYNVAIITIDGHEYIHYRDGNNAAAVGGIVHKADCKLCAKNKSVK